MVRLAVAEDERPLPVRDVPRHDAPVSRPGDGGPGPIGGLLCDPLVGGKGEDRQAWLDAVRALDWALRGPRPPPGLAGILKSGLSQQADVTAGAKAAAMLELKTPEEIDA